MIRPYECMVVFDGTLPEDVLQKEQHAIEEILKTTSSFEKTDVWGKRALAYPIRKKRTGYYCLFLFEGDVTPVAAIDKHIKLNDNVLRYLTLVRNLKNEAARIAAATRREKAAELPPKIEEEE